MISKRKEEEKNRDKVQKRLKKGRFIAFLNNFPCKPVEEHLGLRNKQQEKSVAVQLTFEERMAAAHCSRIQHYLREQWERPQELDLSQLL